MAPDPNTKPADAADLDIDAAYAPESAGSSGGFLGLFFDHPKGLYALFFTEMWERFSFYLMIALLSLYMTDYLTFAPSKASDITTWYMSLVYFTPFLGGLIADKLTGYIKAVVIGGLLMMAGHIVLAFDSKSSEYHIFLFAALGLLILGNGMFKPNISTMVGSLYGEGDPRRDRGFTIFYMGINVGAFLAPIAANLFRTESVDFLNRTFGTSLQKEDGWHIAFGSAGVGMLLSLVIFVANKARLGLSTTAHKGKASEDGEASSAGDGWLATVQWFNMGAVFLALVALLFGGFKPLQEMVKPTYPWLTDVILFGIVWLAIELITVILFLIGGRQVTLNAAKLKAVYIIIALFWMAFHQNSVTLTFFAKDHSEPLLPLKPGQTPADAAELFQSINALCILLFSPILVFLWSTLGKSGRDPGSTTKMVIGMLLTSLAYVVMIGAGLAGGDTGRVSAMWLTGCYMIITVAELLVSPIGLSLTSKLAPPKYKGLWMGFWFMATAVGNKLVHVIGQFYETYKPSQLFLILVISSVAAAVALVVILAILGLFKPKDSATV